MKLHQKATTIILILTTFVMLGCSVFPDPLPGLDKEKAGFALYEGTGCIEGDLFARTAGGETKSGAGLIVELTPDQLHFRESFERAEVNGFTKKLTYHSPVNGLSADYVRTSYCDGQGRFRFEELPAGTYLLHGMVTWHVGKNLQLANAIQSVTVTEGKTVTVSLHAQ